MAKKTRFRPTLKQYRKIEDEKRELILDAADSAIEFGMLNEENERNKREYQIQEAITKDLLERKQKLEFALSLADQTSEKWRKEVCSLSEETIDLAESWSKTALLAFLLSIVTITCSAYQIFHAL